jgi:hypothetical protein
MASDASLPLEFVHPQIREKKIQWEVSAPEPPLAMIS